MHAVGGVGVAGLVMQPVADRDLVPLAGGFQHRVESDRLAELDVISGRLQIQFGPFRIEQVHQHVHQRLVFGHLREHQADQPVADDEIVRAGDLGQLAVAHVQHLADDGEAAPQLLAHVAQVQQRDQRARVGILRGQGVHVAQRDDVIVGLDVQVVQQAAVGGAARLEAHRQVLQIGAIVGQRRLDGVALRHDRDRRAGRDV